MSASVFCLQAKLRAENEAYLIAHPELKRLLSLYMSKGALVFNYPDFHYWIHKLYRALIGQY